MKRKIMVLLGALILVFGSVATVQAEDYEGGSGWSVRFVGNGMESNFKTADINDAVYNLQPGDSISITVALENGSSKTGDWWMTNKVLRSLEDTQRVASGGGYTYTLAYTDPSGERRLLYASDTVGGEKEGELSGEGLREATDSLEEYFYLDTLTAGERGYISLKVSLDGETQGNTYQDTLADLQMNFAVEETTRNPVPVDETRDPENTPEPSPGGRGPTKPPKTSDDADLFPYIAASLVSGIALLILAFYSMKHDRKEKEGGTGK